MSQVKSKQEVIEAIQAVSKKLGGGPLSQTQFLRESEISYSNVTPKWFPTWGAACEAAGVEPDA